EHSVAFSKNPLAGGESYVSRWWLGRQNELIRRHVGFSPVMESLAKGAIQGMEEAEERFHFLDVCLGEHRINFGYVGRGFVGENLVPNVPISIFIDTPTHVDLLAKQLHIVQCERVPSDDKFGCLRSGDLRGFFSCPQGVERKDGKVPGCQAHEPVEVVLRVLIEDAPKRGECGKQHRVLSCYPEQGILIDCAENVRAARRQCAHRKVGKKELLSRLLFLAEDLELILELGHFASLLLSLRFIPANSPSRGCTSTFSRIGLLIETG